VPILSFEDLYGGKICAALARQHPRDLFDVKLLFENEGITDKLRQAFIIYLASSPRPIHELLNPHPALQELRQAYEEDFVGMTKHTVLYEDLMQVRLDLISQLLKSFTNNERLFLLSLKSGMPDWDLMPIPGIENLPGLKWKLMNIEKMDQAKHKIALEKLKQVLSL